MGATTIWELWDSMLPDGTIHPGGMTCFNHYALGAVADWMHRVIAGAETAEPGYSRVGDRPPTRRQPHLGPRITADLLRPGHRLLGDHRQRRPHHHRRPAQRHNRRRHRARTAAGDRGLRPPHPQRAQMYKHARTAAAIPRTVRSDTAACPRRAPRGVDAVHVTTLRTPDRIARFCDILPGQRAFAESISQSAYRGVSRKVPPRTQCLPPSG